MRLMVVWALLQVHVVLKLWKSGFSLDSGELRSYQDPSNAQFLDDIRRGYVATKVVVLVCCYVARRE